MFVPWRVSWTSYHNFAAKEEEEAKQMAKAAAAASLAEGVVKAGCVESWIWATKKWMSSSLDVQSSRLKVSPCRIPEIMRNSRSLLVHPGHSPILSNPINGEEIFWSTRIKTSTPKLPRHQVFFPERRYGFIDSNGLAPWQIVWNVFESQVWTVSPEGFLWRSSWPWYAINLKKWKKHG